MADLILVLKDGEIVEQGEHHELLDRNGIYRQLYNLQFQEQETSYLPPSVSTFAESLDSSLAEGDSGQTPGADAKEKHPGGSLSGSDEIIYGKPYDSRVVTRISGYFKTYRTAMILTIAATLLFTFSSVANPYLIGLAENRYIVAGDVNGLNIIVLVFVGMAVLNLVSYYTQIRAEALLGQNILLTLRTRLFDHLQRLSLSVSSAIMR